MKTNTKRLLKNLFVPVLIFFWVFSGWPRIWNNPVFPPEIKKVYAATQTYTSGSGNWVSPVTATVTVELWGGGGAGGKGGGSNKNGGGGGAGGQYATKQVAVTKGTSYAYSVGAGGTSTSTNGNPGGDTTFGSSTVVAKGGAGGKSYANGFAGGLGSALNGVGDTVYAGGSGANGSAVYSGGGGGGAGSTGAGGLALTTTGGTGKSLSGGNGGNGSTANSGAGGVGNNYGGAGAGATKSGTPGAGAGGYIVITYPDNASPSVSQNTADAYDFSMDATPTLEFTGTDANYVDDVRYNIQIDTVNTFNSGNLLDKVSGTNPGFLNTVTGGDTDPFNSGEKASYTVQAGETLSGGTYYWRVRGIDPSGTNTYGSWSSTRTFSVTAISISISVSDGSVSYGMIAKGATQDTTSSGVNDSQTATNNGNVSEDFNIKGQNSASWTLAATQGTDQYFHKFCNNGTCDVTPTWTALTTNYQALAANISVSGTQEFDLQVGIPSATSVGTQQSVNVTVQAVQH